MIIDFSLILKSIPYVLSGLPYTFGISLLSFMVGNVFAIILAFMRMSQKPWLKYPARVYISIMRGVPMLVVLFILYFGLPYVGVQLPALLCAFIGFSCVSAAYMAEIFRAGIQSVDKGQMEAARSLGLGYGKAMQKVILPQAIRTMVPSIINQFIISLKDTSILSVIGFPELTKAGNIIVGNTFKVLEVWAIVAIMYMIVITILSKLAKRIERRLNVGKER